MKIPTTWRNRIHHTDSIWR